MGNKCDHASHRCVETERGIKVLWHFKLRALFTLLGLHLQIAENFEMPFFEVSCKQNINIERAFLTLARNIRQQCESKQVNYFNVNFF